MDGAASSSLRLADEDVDAVPCKEDVRASGGRAGDLVRMARYEEKE